uniref:CUB-like domain-containing protein n=1 Tax=Panagrolaimus sp. PS1159 TaxID=55785 RepID=A0AC35EYX4_9BILA
MDPPSNSNPSRYYTCDNTLGFPCILSVTNSTSLSWNTDVAFQGMIIVDTWKFGCPLESATNPNPYKFTDETEIIFMTSTFSSFKEINNLHIPSNFPCMWHFTAPRMRKFKFVLTNFPQTSATLTITNQDGQIVNISETNKPYYFDDIYITIRFNTTDKKDYFQGYLSIVKLASDLIDGNCLTVKNDDGSVFWSTIRENQTLGSYPNNAICTYNLSIPSINQMIAVFYMLDIETNVDTMHFYMNDLWVDVHEG